MGVYVETGPGIAGVAYQIPPVTYPFLKRNPLFRGFILKFLALIPSPPPGPDISGLFFCPAQSPPGAGKSPRTIPLDLDSARRNPVNRANAARPTGNQASDGGRRPRRGAGNTPGNADPPIAPDAPDYPRRPAR